MARTTLLLLSILFLLPTNAAIKKLQVEYLTNPIGLDITAPRFSWQLESAERGVRQTAYQIGSDRCSLSKSGLDFRKGGI